MEIEEKIKILDDWMLRLIIMMYKDQYVKLDHKDCKEIAVLLTEYKLFLVIEKHKSDLENVPLR